MQLSSIDRPNVVRMIDRCHGPEGEINSAKGTQRSCTEEEIPQLHFE